VAGGILLNPSASGSGDCCCGGGECTVHLIACDGTGNLAGASVTIKDSGGTTLDSGTTDASGNFATTAGCGSNRTVTVAATGYTTHDFTGQTLSSTVLTLNMASYMDTTNYVCCFGCPFPKTLHYTFNDIHNGVPISGSGTGTYQPSTQAWPLALGSMVCSFETGAGLSLLYDDPDAGTISCLWPATSVTCNPLNIVFDTPTDPPCINFAGDTGITYFHMVVTA
jgi:hypothetical protein